MLRIYSSASIAANPLLAAVIESDYFSGFQSFFFVFQILSYLYNTNLVDTLRNSNGQDTIKVLVNNDTTASDVAYFHFWTGVSGSIGLLVAFILSLIISIRRHWFWVNSLIAFVVTYILYRYDVLGWTYLKRVFWYLGQKFDNSTVEFLFNGIILLIIGLLVFLLRRPNQFIEKK